MNPWASAVAASRSLTDSPANETARRGPMLAGSAKLSARARSAGSATSLWAVAWLARRPAMSATPAAHHIDEVVGVLGLAAVGEREGLEYDERGRAADRDHAVRLLALQGEAFDRDFLSLLEGQLEAGRDERAEVALQGLYLTTLFRSWNGWHEEVDRDFEIVEPPALRRRISAVVDVRFEALLAQSPADLAVLLVVEQGDGKADVEVVGPAMALSGLGVPSDLMVDEQAWDQAADDAYPVE